MLLRRLGLALLATFALAAPAAAQSFPQRNITILVPSAPGGTLDALARFFAQAMQAPLGRSVVVENVSGGGGLIGMQRLARSDADGHTLAFGNMGIMAAGYAINPDSGFDPRRDMASIGLVADVPMVIAASPRGNIRTLAALLDHFRRNGEQATFGHGGVGTTGYLAPAFLLALTNLRGTLVSYRGAGPAMNDLAAGVVDAVIDQTVTMIPAHRGGTAVALAVSGTQRLPQLPDVPTFAEAGTPGFDLVVWNAFAAPRGTPPAVVAQLHAALAASLQDAELRRRLQDLAAVVPDAARRGPDAMQRIVAEDVAKWSRLVEQGAVQRQ